MELHKKKSKLLSYILRHSPDEYGITLMRGGWASTDKVLNALNMSWEELEQLVRTDAKGRYSFSQDNFLIRANQGHSVNINMGFEPIQPPDVLYHGTGNNAVAKLVCDGIKKMNRQHVHMSKDKATAFNVGARHGHPCVVEIKAKQMFEDGYEFYQSENGVWLTDHVPKKYFDGIHVV